MSAIMTMYSSSDEDVTTERRADPKGVKVPPGRLQNEKGISQLFARRSLHSPLSVLRQTPSETPSNKKREPPSIST